MQCEEGASTPSKLRRDVVRGHTQPRNSRRALLASFSPDSFLEAGSTVQVRETHTQRPFLGSFLMGQLSLSVVYLHWNPSVSSAAFVLCFCIFNCENYFQCTVWIVGLVYLVN